MTPRYLIESFAQRRDYEIAFESELARQIVDGAGLVKLIREPYALLRERHRQEIESAVPPLYAALVDFLANLVELRHEQSKLIGGQPFQELSGILVLAIPLVGSRDSG